MINKAILTLVLSVPLYSFAHTGATALLLFRDGDSTCSSAAVGVIPVGAENVNCSAIASAVGYTYIDSMRVAGDSTCISGSESTVEILCKAYNGK